MTPAIHSAAEDSALDIRGIDKFSLAEVEEALRLGARFVHFEYCVSLVVLTWRVPTNIYLLWPHQRGVVRGLPYLLLTLALGWWGLPWGLWLTPQVLFLNLSGGRDVTAEVVAFLRATYATAP